MRRAVAGASLAIGVALSTLPGLAMSAATLEWVESIPLRETSPRLTDTIAFRYDRSSQTLLILDRSTRRIVEFDRAGIPLHTTELAPTTGHPRALALDPRGDLVVALDAGATLLRIRRGATTSAEDVTPLELECPSEWGLARRWAPAALEFGDDGSLLVAEGANRVLLVFDPSMRAARVVRNTGAAIGIRFHRNEFYLVDARRGGVLELDSDFRVLRRLAARPERYQPPLFLRAVAFDSRDRLWCLEESGSIAAIARDDRLDFQGRPTELLRPVDLQIDERGSLLVLDQAGECVHVFEIRRAPGHDEGARW